MCDNLECPNCGEDAVAASWDLIGADVVCPNERCQCGCVVEYDYLMPGVHRFWLVESPSWIQRMKERDEKPNDKDWETAESLHHVDFPECASRCGAVRVLGVSECDFVCPHKQEDDE